jgi:hypothetical protein
MKSKNISHEVDKNAADTFLFANYLLQFLIFKLPTGPNRITEMVHKYACMH